MTELIKVTQLPITENDWSRMEECLRSAKDVVDARVSEALSLICTEETVQTVKDHRADLRRQFDELEEQRKAVKAAVFDPYDRFEQIYRECVSDAFRSADVTLKGKIDEVEAEIKGRCEAGLREYFAELCAAHHLDFLRYEQAGVKVDMASAKQKTPKKLREQLERFVDRVSCDIDRIAGMEDAEEIMAEYKRTLDAMGAIGTVRERHRRIEEERSAREAREAARAREAEAVRRVEAVAPPVQMEPDPVLRCTFTVHATKPQLRKLKEFMLQEEIRYE